MNPSMSCLNPHAASYIPMNKTEKKDEQKTDLLLHYVSEGTAGTEQDSFQGNAASDSGYELESDLEELLDQAEAEGSEMYLNCLDQEEHAEKHLEYLEIWFPNISEQCLADVFSDNHGDLGASVHMLRELESSPDTVSKPLHAVSLDTADASEFEVVSRRKKTRERERTPWLPSTDCVRCYVVR